MTTSPFCAELMALTKTALVDPVGALAGGVAGARHENRRPGLGAVGGSVGGSVGGALGAVGAGLASRGNVPLTLLGALGGSVGGGYLGGQVASHLAGPSEEALNSRALKRMQAKQASAARQILSLAKKHKGKVGLVVGGAIAHDQGSQAYKDWKLGRQYRKSMERGRG